MQLEFTLATERVISIPEMWDLDYLEVKMLEECLVELLKAKRGINS